MMPQVISGSLQASPKTKVAVVVSQFNHFITDSLQKACVDTLQALGVQPQNITIITVPGAFELSPVCSRIARSGTVDAVIALGCVIRGATTHYDYVCSEAAKGIAKASAQSGLPVIFGVITTETIEQAIERSGTKAGNKGADAAMAAIQMVSLLEKLPAAQTTAQPLATV